METILVVAVLIVFAGFMLTLYAGLAMMAFFAAYVAVDTARTLYKSGEKVTLARVTQVAEDSFVEITDTFKMFRVP